MKVENLMNPDAQSCGPQTSVLEVARQMRDHHVGTVAVCDDGKLLGVIQERDIAVLVVASELDPARTSASEVMSALVNYCFTSDTLDIAISMMEEEKIGQLLVLDHQLKLVGVVSLCELIRHVMNESAEAAPRNPGQEHRVHDDRPAPDSGIRNGVQHSMTED